MSDPELALDALLDEAEGQDPDDALVVLDGASAEVKALSGYHYARSTMLFAKDAFLDAEAAAREAMRLDPSIPEYRSNLGAILIAEKRFDEGLALLEQAAEEDPLTALVHNNLGVALDAAGRYEEAVRAFDTALVIDPDDEAVQKNRAAVSARASSRRA